MKTFVKITTIDENGAVSDTVQTFDSQAHYLIFWENKPENVTAAQILNPEEIEKYLEPFRLHFILADRKKAEAKAILEEIGKAAKSLHALTGDNYFFQDDQDIIYKTGTSDGRYVYYEPVEIKRTRREGEDKGSLSLTVAREAGFVVEGK